MTQEKFLSEHTKKFKEEREEERNRILLQIRNSENMKIKQMVETSTRLDETFLFDFKYVSWALLFLHHHRRRRRLLLTKRNGNASRRVNNVHILLYYV